MKLTVGAPIEIDGVKVELKRLGEKYAKYVFLYIYETTSDEYYDWHKYPLYWSDTELEIDDDVLTGHIHKYYKNRLVASLDHEEMVDVNGYLFCMYDNVLVILKDGKLVYAERNEKQHDFLSGRTPITMDTVRIVLGDDIEYNDLIIGQVMSIGGEVGIGRNDRD